MIYQHINISTVESAVYLSTIFISSILDIHIPTSSQSLLLQVTMNLERSTRNGITLKQLFQEHYQLFTRICQHCKKLNVFKMHNYYERKFFFFNIQVKLTHEQFISYSFFFLLYKNLNFNLRGKTSKILRKSKISYVCYTDKNVQLPSHYYSDLHIRHDSNMLK